MNTLMHDFEVVSRIADLVSTLKGSYKVGNATILPHLMWNFSMFIRYQVLLKYSDQGEYDGQGM
jgi:hypothetical protein